MTEIIGARISAFLERIKPSKEKPKRTRRESAGDEVRVSDRKWNALLFLALAVGCFFLAYPSAADYWNSFHQYRAIMQYADQVANMKTEEYLAYIEAAHAYNTKLSEIYSEINKMEKARTTVDSFPVYKELFLGYALAALLCLLLEMLVKVLVLRRLP